MPRPVALLLAAALSFAACYGDEEEPEFPFATVLLDNGEETTLLTVEVAETPEQQRRGLAGRTSLAGDRGMVFVFFEERESGLSMKRLRIPLSIAYFAADGEIVGIVDAGPCGDGRCGVPPPGAPYMGALAVNRSAFEEWDVSEGDEVRLTR